ncbi:MAG: MoaD/ThiS family protein [Planctomycetes bacterium]|nr:MoaD/ThiS family protein [Planctomycetota bacterium]NBY03121.1 MoaD/ThiS family protein [Planctomycetota bacterium]
MIKISVVFFAGARDIVGRNRLEIEIPPQTNIAELREILIVKFPRLEDLARRAAFAVNEIFVLTDTLLVENDEVAFLPAVSGG